MCINHTWDDMCTVSLGYPWWCCWCCAVDTGIFEGIFIYHQSWSKHLCSHRVRRTSVLEETHPRPEMFLSLCADHFWKHSQYLHSVCTLIQTVPSVDKSLGEKVPSHFQFDHVFDQLVIVTSEMLECKGNPELYLVRVQWLWWRFVDSKCSSKNFIKSLSQF